MPNVRIAIMGLFILLFTWGCTAAGPTDTAADSGKASSPTGEAPFEEPPENKQAEPWPSSLYLLNFMDSWNQAAEEVHSRLKEGLPVRKEVYDYWIRWVTLSLDNYLEKMHLTHIWKGLWTGERNEDVRLEALVCKNDGRIITILLSGSAETPLTETKLAFLRPYFEILIAVANPDLSLQDRQDIMHQLLLYADVQTLDEAFADPEKTRPSATAGRVYYEVTILGSDLGGTVAVEATLAGSCSEKWP
ncbi:MAG: hypothetical protein KM310_11110 [Clostridiales bacterium]|nr:hypothetical protein [Clostridiales bacterium]